MSSAVCVALQSKTDHLSSWWVLAFLNVPKRCDVIVRARRLAVSAVRSDAGADVGSRDGLGELSWLIIGARVRRGQRCSSGVIGQSGKFGSTVTEVPSSFCVCRF